MLSADHHTHLFSPAAAARISEVRAAPPSTATDLLAVLDGDDVGAALVLSVGYFFAMPDLGEPDDAAVAAENNWAAGEVDRHRDRLAACCSVNPLAPGAIAEIERCAATGAYVGLKLHLANSDVDLRDSTHLEAVGDVFECANTNSLMMVVHMRTRRGDYGAEDADRFLQGIVPRAPAVAIQIAHVGGWGGYDVATDAAFGVFADWTGSHPTEATNLYFDIAIAPLDYEPPGPVAHSTAGEGPDAPWSSRRWCRLAERVRAVGIDKVLFGTDWPVIPPGVYLPELERRLPLEEEELEQLRRNTGPWLTPVA